MSQVTTGSKTKANTEKYSGYNWRTCHIKYYNDIWDTIILEPIMNVTAPPLHSSAVSAVEAIRHVDGHVGSSQLFKRLGIQNQEECPFILKKSEIWSGTSTWSTHLERFLHRPELVGYWTSYHLTVCCSAISIRQLWPGLILALIIHHLIFS